MADLDQPRLPSRAQIPRVRGPRVLSGTALATLKSNGSIPTKGSWGGARNRRDRTSWHLSKTQCEGLIAAARYAEHIGLAFNRHWTVHYERAGIADIDAPEFIGRLLKLARDYSTRKKNGHFTALWVRENGEGKGGHVHILMHMPAERTLRGRTRRWVTLAGGKYKPRTSRVVSIGGRLISADSGSEHYQHNVGAVLAYVLKGADHQTGEALSLPRSGEGGLVIGKRCGWSQNIGKGSRIEQETLRIGKTAG
ncbi:MAG: hypothetical protein ACK4Z8_02915 [Novosphingobium sp.]